MLPRTRNFSSKRSQEKSGPQDAPFTAPLCFDAFAAFAGSGRSGGLDGGFAVCYQLL